MGTRKSPDFFKAEKFVQSLRGLVESLPSESEKQQLSANLDMVIGFLSEIKKTVGSLPSQESAVSVQAAIDGLNSLFARARSSAPLAGALGLQPCDRKPKAVPVTEVDSERARALLEKLEKLPINDLRANLENSSATSPRDLHAIAALLGIRSTQRSSRESLVHQIASKIANARGYEALRRGTEDSGSPQ
ncbi:MAG TPA: hypothetical protein VE999_01665 [Gemmataceae bacterium]|nr:hypothetical protein [Bryobacteraceae bacterium]HZV03772.1 hypothetical protein [Gemmataceae bacterium]